MPQLAALLAGMIIAVPAILLTAAVVRLLRQGHTQRAILALGELIAMLFGTPIAGTFIGARVTNDVLWPWFVTGEAVLFVPGGVLVAYRALLRDP